MPTLLFPTINHQLQKVVTDIVKGKTYLNIGFKAFLNCGTADDQQITTILWINTVNSSMAQYHEQTAHLMHGAILFHISDCNILQCMEHLVYETFYQHIFCILKPYSVAFSSFTDTGSSLPINCYQFLLRIYYLPFPFTQTGSLGDLKRLNVYSSIEIWISLFSNLKKKDNVKCKM